MEQEKIEYQEIIDLGFKEDKSPTDNVYFRTYGFDYVIISKKLSKKLTIFWAKETQFCQMVRVDNNKEGNVMGRMDLENLEEVKTIIDFFTDYHFNNNDIA